jgi:hypothetical protein
METTPGGTASDESAPASGQSWALPLVLAVALAAAAFALIALRGRQGEPVAESKVTSAEVSWAPPLSPQAQSLSLEVDFGNGVRREFAALPWKEGMTVGDLLRAAGRVAPGLTFAHKGQGKMSFLTSIDGIANGAGDGRFWLYEVNGVSGEVSFEVQSLAAGDRVLWAFKHPE